MFNLTARRPRQLAIWGALAFIVSTLQYGIAQIIAAAAWHPAYSWRTNFISDLGNTACGQFALHAPAPTCAPPAMT